MASSARPQVSKIDHLHLATRDMDQSIRFYTELLGFSLVRRVRLGPEESAPQIAYIALGDALVELTEVRHDNPLQGNEGRPFGMSVDDLDAAMEQFAAHGVEIVSEPKPALTFSGRQAVIRDPSGVLLEIRQWDASDVPMSPGWKPQIDGVVCL